MAREKILVVDDEEDILELVRFNLTREGFRVKVATTGEQALRVLEFEPVDLMVLDLMLPGMDGFSVAKKVRSHQTISELPIIMLTAKGEEADTVAGLELGADDYMVKPFSPRILTARVRAVLRRKQAAKAVNDTRISIRGIHIHHGMRSVRVGDDPVDLTFTEFGILSLLASRPGWVFTRTHIVDAVRGEDYPVTDRSVDVHIAGLRKKLGPAGAYIETVRGVGYRFCEEN